MNITGNTEQDMLLVRCSWCNAEPEEKCATKSGKRATKCHIARWYELTMHGYHTDLNLLIRKRQIYVASLFPLRPTRKEAA